MRPSRTLIQVVAAVVAGVYLGSFAAQGVPIHGNWFAPLGAAASAASLVLIAFDNWLWRIPGIRPHIAQRPLLDGTWAGTLTSHYVDPETGERVPADPDVFLVIRQKYWSITVRLYTKESKSFSMVGLLDRAGDGVYGLYSIYRNTPRLSVRHRSPIHHGALMLDISGEPASRLEGFYWTDRRTMGELDLDQRFKGHIGDHHAGMALKQRAQTTSS